MDLMNTILKHAMTIINHIKENRVQSLLFAIGTIAVTILISIGFLKAALEIYAL